MLSEALDGDNRRVTGSTDGDALGQFAVLECARMGRALALPREADAKNSKLSLSDLLDDRRRAAACTGR